MTENSPPRRIVRLDEYWPFIVGTVVLGGLVIYPVLTGFLPEKWFPAEFSSLERRMGLGILIAVVFSLCHNRNLDFLFNRFIGAIIAISYFSWMSRGGDGSFYIFSGGGLLGFLAMYAGGQLGIFLAGVFGDAPTMDSDESESEGLDSNMQNLAQNTLQALGQGVVSKAMRRWLEVADDKELTLDSLKAKLQEVPSISFHFSHHAPSADEYVFAASEMTTDRPMLMDDPHYVLTNRYLYVFMLRRPRSLNKVDRQLIEHCSSGRRSSEGSIVSMTSCVGVTEEVDCESLATALEVEEEIGNFLAGFGIEA